MKNLMTFIFLILASATVFAGGGQEPMCDSERLMYCQSNDGETMNVMLNRCDDGNFIGYSLVFNLKDKLSPKYLNNFTVDVNFDSTFDFNGKTTIFLSEVPFGTSSRIAGSTFLEIVKLQTPINGWTDIASVKVKTEDKKMLVEKNKENPFFCIESN